MGGNINFQEMTLLLVNFWKDRGCLLSQSHNNPIGAGTLNPATALRILGPEPWRAVYVETSVRPEDGRFGESTNRLQRHHQLQVILKPDPGDPQEQFLHSLEAVGIEAHRCDIRFIPNDRQYQTLGIWGRGWEVLLNGQEIAQFTYIQHAAGEALGSIPVEITYGLERLAMMLQGVDSVWNIRFSQEMLYKDLWKTNELQYSIYHFEKANIKTLKRLYALNAKESVRCLAEKLILPAYNYNLRCIYLFNVLMARGAVSVGERAKFYQQIRSHYYEIAKSYIALREALDFPLLVPSAQPSIEPVPPPSQTMPTKGSHSFLLEIGTEELPGYALKSALSQLRTLVPEFFKRLEIPIGRIEVDGTPRRIAINVHAVSGQQLDQENGEAQKTVPLLASKLPQLIDSIRFYQDMRWNDTAVSFSRPIRWLVALYGKDLIPFRYGGVMSGRTSRGIRPERAPEIRITDAYSYAGIMRKHGITHVVDKRKEKIVVVATKLAAEKKGVILEDPILMDEIANLVERPTPLRGQFDERFLTLPPELLILVMTKQQRYFPIFDSDNTLLPYFMSVRNGDEKHLDMVIEGNEMVLNARFADAEFFYQKDMSRPLDEFVPLLKSVVVYPALGSMYDKTNRLVSLTAKVSGLLGLSEADQKIAARAAYLAKADLASLIVQEMEALRGVMGGHYAEKSGEPAAVGAAIAEQYTAVSRTEPGLALALADRFDTLAGLCLSGYTPHHSNDPFRLNLLIQQLIENMISNKVDLDCRILIEAAVNEFGNKSKTVINLNILNLVSQNLQRWLHEHTDSSADVTNLLSNWEKTSNFSRLVQVLWPVGLPSSVDSRS